MNSSSSFPPSSAPPPLGLRGNLRILSLLFASAVAGLLTVEWLLPRFEQSEPETSVEERITHWEMDDSKPAHPGS